jgi:PAS domain-containing protein
MNQDASSMEFDGRDSPRSDGVDSPMYGVDSPIYSLVDSSGKQEEGADRRRLKHNEGETRRRKRLNLKFHDLKLLINSPSDTKPAIIKDTCQYITVMRTKLARYQNMLGNIETEATMAPVDVARDPYVQIGLQLDFRNIFACARAPRLVTDISDVIVSCNDGFAELVGYNREFILTNRATHASLLEPNCRILVSNMLKGLLMGRRRSGHVKVIYQTPQHEQRDAIASAWLAPFNGKIYFDHVFHCNPE